MVKLNQYMKNISPICKKIDPRGFKLQKQEKKKGEKKPHTHHAAYI